MKFRDLLHGVEASSVRGDAEVTAVEYDSRKVRPGSLFIAIRGESTDGNQYIKQALTQGAAAVVSDAPGVAGKVAGSAQSIASAEVRHGRRAMAGISANFYQHPAQRLKVTGVTGTNGKTTTTFLIESLLQSSGRSSALIGTIEYHIAARVVPSPHTTPESLELNKFFAEAVEAGATEAVMEVSSHALAQGRVWGIPYDVAVFTNLTRDHLDYHKTMEEYFGAKCSLFTGCGAQPPRVAIINVDDDYGRKLAELIRGGGSEVIGYGLGEGAGCRAVDIEYSPSGTRFRLQYRDLALSCNSPLVGEINVYNLMAAAMAAYARGCSSEQIEDAIARFERVPGRFERVDAGQPFTVVVDYAHTDDALRNLIRIARRILDSSKKTGRIITLFGCGGDRDRSKRPLMGRAAGEGSDFVVLTSDNPRSEDPMAIIREAQAGLAQTQTRYVIEPERAKAIEIAIGEARPGDIVLLAGKGHEKVQITRAGTFPFDDVEVARLALAGIGHENADHRRKKGVPVA